MSSDLGPGWKYSREGSKYLILGFNLYFLVVT